MYSFAVKLSSYSMCPKGLGGSPICEANNIHRSYGIYNRTSKHQLWISMLNFLFSCFKGCMWILTWFSFVLSAVYQSYCPELKTPFKRRSFVCCGESFEAFSSKFICVALHVLLFFSPLVCSFILLL